MRGRSPTGHRDMPYARATVALTRARKMCVIFCSLDMEGLIGAAAVMESLMYGAEHCWMR